MKFIIVQIKQFEKVKTIQTPALKSLILLAFIATIIFTGSCSRKRNTMVSRAWHNTTSHYNGYFNAREKVQEVAKKLATAQPDKFERTLSIFKLGDDNQAKANYPDLDEAIKKSSIVIQKHSIKIKGKEYCKWIDENYLMVGLAQFYKHDYWTAIEAFQFTASEYKESNSRYDAMIWLTLTYMQLGKMVDAEYVIDFLNNQSKMTPKQKQLFSLVKADYYSKKDDIPNEIKALEEAVANSRKKDDKVRYRFILAQLYQKLGDSRKAYGLYEKVIKMNPYYELAFNAKINRARVFDAESASGGTVKKQLNKMLRDDKNKEYRDQIYYALAGIAKKESKELEEIDLLKKSVATSVSNNNQKAISYLDLGEISFSKKNYRAAQAYYDSTMQFLTKDYPTYDQISNKKSTLTRLVENMMVIENEDSLQAIAKLSEKEREDYIAGIIKKENEEKERQKLEAEKKKQEEIQNENQVNQTLNEENIRKNTNQQIPGAGNGAWYFYNTATLSFGFNEFIKKWGNRPLEDNWRRKEKESQALANSEQGEDKIDMTAYNDSISKLADAKRKEIYLKKLPVTSEALVASNAKIDEAYYNIGIIYREQLKEYPQSRDNFEGLLERFPDSKFKLPSYYNLYRLYSALGNAEKAEYYKNLLLTKYADSDYAKLILNPEYFNNKQQRADIIQTYYENTYKAYQNQQFLAVIERKNEADSLFPPNSLTPKFELLKSLAIGKTRPISDFELSLRDVIAHYPKDSVSITAKNILDYITKNNLNGGKKAVNQEVTDSSKTENINQSDSTQANNELPKTPFAFNPDTIHYFVMVFENKTINLNELKIKISNFNTKFYSVAGYQINNAFIGSEKQYLAVKQFTNREEASSYMETLLSDEEVFDDKSNYEYQVFLISPSNFGKLMVTKDIEGYLNFYDEQYSQ